MLRQRGFPPSLPSFPTPLTMAADFDAKPSGQAFPPTRRSAVVALGSDDPAERARAFELLVRVYWKPAYKHVRLKWRRDAEDAADLIQGFFARALEKQGLASYDVGRARFRTYLKGSLDNFVLETARSASRQKRGGSAFRISLDFDVAEEELSSAGVLSTPLDASSVETYFEREWTRQLFASAVESLEAYTTREGKAVYFEVFRRYVLEPEMSGADRTSYAEVARNLGISVTDVTNYLAWTKRELRNCIVEALREITTSDAELDEEIRAVLGGAGR